MEALGKGQTESPGSTVAPRKHLLGALDGQLVLTPAPTWDQAKQSLLNSATARAPAAALLRYHQACNDVWQDLWSQRCEGGYFPYEVCHKQTQVWSVQD